MRSVPDAVRWPAGARHPGPGRSPSRVRSTTRSVDVVGEIVARQAPWTMRLVERRRWSDAIYAAIDPEAPAVALQADLAAAFPSLPIYGGTIDVFVPHVTIAEGLAVGDPALDVDPGPGTSCR